MTFDIIKTKKTIGGKQTWVYLGIQHITDPSLNGYIGKKKEEYSQGLKDDY